MQSTRADKAAAAILRGLLGTIESTIPGAITGEDAEQLHDLRVAVRQTRTVVHGLSAVFPPADAERLLAEFKWLQQLTNPTRDLDVLLIDLENANPRIAADLVPVKRSLSKRRTAERRVLKRGLSSARLKKLLEDWRVFIDELPAAGAADRPDAESPIKKVAGARIAKRYKQLAKLSNAAKRDRSPEAIHELRKRAKELRYFLGFFQDLYPRWAVKPLRSDLKSLHAVLGGFRDRLLQEQLLREAADELLAAGSGAAPVLATGALLDEMARAQAAADEEFAKTVASLTAKKRRAIVKSEFR